MFTSPHSDFTHVHATPTTQSSHWDFTMCSLCEYENRGMQPCCANMKFWLWLGWVQFKVPDSAFTGLGSGFTKTSITGIHFGEERMKDLLEQNWPAFHTSTPPQTNLNYLRKTRTQLHPGMDTFHLKLLLALCSRTPFSVCDCKEMDSWSGDSEE